MAEDNKKTTFYEILLTRTIPDKNIPEITDFAYLMFIREPGTKQASYAVAQANVPTATLITIESEINAGKLSEYQLQIRQIKDDKPKLIYSGFVKILLPKNYIQDKRNIKVDGTSPTLPVQMIFVNPVIWDLNLQTSFNFVFNDSKRKALSVFTDLYIPEIKKKHAGSISSKSIKYSIFADMQTQNNTLYDQITIPSSITEIQVPEYIIDAYKPFSTPSLWLFDIFNFGNYDGESEPINGEIPIWCILLNFYNALETFKKKDISKDIDIKQFTRLIKTIPYTDYFENLCKPNSIISFVNTCQSTQITELFGNLPKIILTDNASQQLEERVNSLKVEFSDSLEEARKRIVDCVSLIQKQINQIEIYETINTSPDWLQFGYLYNLERDKKTGENLNRYIHTPLVILNIFKRQEQTEGKMDHLIKYSMIRFYSDEKVVKNAT